MLSQHIGDLENWETYRSYVAGIEHYRRLFDVEPALVAHDLHPDYLSTAYALEQAGVEAVGVQHHHAHIASCLADNGVAGPVIGLALDGTGFGPDGTLWGGEVLVADLTGFRRAGHLAPVPLPGGTAAIRQPWRMAAAYLGSDVDGALPVRRRHAEHWAAVVSLGAGAVRTSSAGRLFDAVAAVTGVRDRISYEGQAAIELEQRVDPTETGGYAPRSGASCPGPTSSGRGRRRAARRPDRRGRGPVPPRPRRRPGRLGRAGPGRVRTVHSGLVRRGGAERRAADTADRPAGRRGSACSPTPGCRPTTPASASVRPSWPPPATRRADR